MSDLFDRERRLKNVTFKAAANLVCCISYQTKPTCNVVFEYELDIRSSTACLLDSSLIIRLGDMYIR